MNFFQKEIILPRYNRGFHLITGNIIEEFDDITKIEKGILHILVKHTSAGITINENADPTVRQDFESHFNKLVPENAPYYKHNYEGPDDMPAHIKTSTIGNQISIPITNGRLNLGTWQGIYFCEFRNYSSNRRVVLTAFGE
jgi:secondary thiamine-phosphate synthase enzyme